MTGRLIVISAPSGGGKTTIAQEILKRHPDLIFSVSATTRRRRSDEVEGRDYHFLTRSEFERLIGEGKLVEWEELFSELYGTLRREVDAGLSTGRSMLFDIDVKGALSIKKLYGDTAVLIFVRPPDIGALTERLRKRNTEDPDALKRRLDRVPMEMEQVRHFDHQVVNDNLEDAVQEVDSLVRAALKKVS